MAGFFTLCADLARQVPQWIVGGPAPIRSGTARHRTGRTAADDLQPARLQTCRTQTHCLHILASRRPNLPVSVAAGHTASHIDRAAVVGVLAKKHADSQHGGERVLSPGPGLSARTLGGTPRSSRRNRGVHRESSQRGGASVLSCVQPFRYPRFILHMERIPMGTLARFTTSPRAA